MILRDEIIKTIKEEFSDTELEIQEISEVNRDL